MTADAVRPDADPDADPHLWLEEVEGPDALAWVRERNAETLAWAEADPAFAALRAELLALLDADDRIPAVVQRGGWLYDHWRDAAHPRGLWRRTTPAAFRGGSPDWEVLLDIDALAAAEGEPWVWAGAQPLPPENERWIVELSRGGADATVAREWHLPSRTFVADGFALPEAKHEIAWVDRHTLLVGTETGPGSLTTSGYPRLLRRWRRGTAVGDAEIVLAAEPDDVAVGAWSDHTPGYARALCTRAIDFYSGETTLLLPDGTRTLLAIPASAEPHLVRDHLLVELREDWATGGTTYPAGALLAIALADFLGGGRTFDVLFAPGPTTALAALVPTRSRVVLDILDDVRHRVVACAPQLGGGWTETPVPGIPDLGSVTLAAWDRVTSDALLVTTADPRTPTTLALAEPDAPPEVLRRLPARFAADDLVVRQRFATSRDGTRIPYLVTGPADLPADGGARVLLTAYGGFEVPLIPGYDPLAGRAWLAAGGVHVVANLRGGGEYGPRWHRAAIRAGRMRAYEDLAAVADDLVATGVTTPARLGVQGGSNGGLLVGNALTLFPERFGAVVCLVPLLDMRRYHLLLAGASWMAEYGDPDDPDDWAFISTWSPYRNVRPDGSYPPMLLLTSTRDDRVHPGHARKMAARMRAQGHRVRYYENTEGGHGGAADNRQAALMKALAAHFLRTELAPADG